MAKATGGQTRGYRISARLKLPAFPVAGILRNN
jgi:hypothetical protein